jgi:glutamate formiminotransferase/formiminotetrahydrofolate cyclodeaminase
VDADTAAFNAVIDAFGLPSNTEAEQAERDRAIQEATKAAIDVPLSVMQTAYESMEVIKVMAETGNPNSVSDAGVGALCALAAVRGAYLNVKINAADLKDKDYLSGVLDRGAETEAKAAALEQQILEIVEAKM